MGSFNLEIETKLKVLTLKFDICAKFRENSLSCLVKLVDVFFLQASVSRQKDRNMPATFFFKEIKKTS